MTSNTPEMEINMPPKIEQEYKHTGSHTCFMITSGHVSQNCSATCPDLQARCIERKYWKNKNIFFKEGQKNKAFVKNTQRQTLTIFCV